MRGMARWIAQRRFLGTLVAALLIVGLASLAGAPAVSAAPADLGTKTIKQGDTVVWNAPAGMTLKLFITGGTKPFLSPTAQSVKVTFNKPGTFSVTVYNGAGTSEGMGTVIVVPSPAPIAPGTADFVSVPPPPLCSLGLEIKAADCVAPSSAAAASAPPDFVPDVSVVPLNSVEQAPTATSGPATTDQSPPLAAPAAPVQQAPTTTTAPVRPAAPPTAPRTGEGGTAAYAHRLGDG